MRFLLGTLGELGLGEKIASELEIGRDDLYLLALIEAECREMARPEGDANGE